MLFQSKSLALFMVSASLTAILSAPVAAMNDDVEMGCCGLTKAIAHYAAKKTEDFVLLEAVANVKSNVTRRIQETITPDPIKIQCDIPLYRGDRRLINQGLKELTCCVVDYTVNEARKGTSFKAGEFSTKFIEKLPENGYSALKVELKTCLDEELPMHLQNAKSKIRPFLEKKGELITMIASSGVYVMSTLAAIRYQPYVGALLGVSMVYDVSLLGNYITNGLKSMFDYNAIIDAAGGYVQHRIDAINSDAALEHYDLEVTEADREDAKDYHKNELKPLQTPLVSGFTAA